MGAWGYKPFCNDSSMDWVSGVADQVAFAIRYAIWGMYYEDSLGAIQLLIDLPEILRQESSIFLKNEALDRLDTIAADTKWISSWKHPKKAVQELERLRKEVQKLPDPPATRKRAHVVKMIYVSRRRPRKAA